MNLSDLQDVYDYANLARLLRISPDVLKSHLYGSRGYRSFTIAKKSGGVRQLAAPNKLRKKLQGAVLPILTDAYRASPHVHGFALGRSVRTNAHGHVGKRTVVNVDLADFFSSISYQRVRGLFLARPFRLSWTAANILAQICCDQGRLPAGGITSPVISNLVCARLDKRLAAMCSRLGGSYTRYADDITMSFDRAIREISPVATVDPMGLVSAGKALAQIINDEGFTINEAKFRAATNSQRKIVTGLVVNQRVNVRRSWYLELESIIYAIEKFGLGAVARKEYPELDPNVRKIKLTRRIHGKIAYYSMVRGKGDWLVAGLANRFNKLHGERRLKVPDIEIISRSPRYGRGVVVVLSYDKPTPVHEDTLHQGTGFVVSSGLIVTASHVVSDEDRPLPHIYVMQERKLKLVECQLMAHDTVSDVAILRPLESHHDLVRVRFGVGQDLVPSENIVAVGFPDYEFREAHVSVQGTITRVRPRSQIAGARALVDAPLQGGMSGGPIVGQDHAVRGLVHRDDTAAGGIAEVVQISEVIRLAISNSLRL